MCSEKFLVIFLLLQVNCCHGTQTGKKKSLWVDVTFHNLALEHPGVYRFAADVNASVDNVDTPSALILKCRLKVNIETETSAFKHEEVISKKYDAGARDKINHKFTFTMANEYQEFMRDIKCSAQLHTTDITGHPSLEAIDLDDK